MDEQIYASEDICVLDIMANTDAPYRLARLAAKFVYHENWSFDKHATDPRGLIISPNFDNLHVRVIYLTMDD